MNHILNDALYSQNICFIRRNFIPPGLLRVLKENSYRNPRPLSAGLFILENQVKLTINGKEREVCSSKTVTELVRELKINAPNIAVALNCQVIPKSQYSETPVKEGDQIEIVHAVGGGI